MKKQIVYLLLFCLHAAGIQAQHLIIKGRIRCINQSAGATRGAENIVVVPAFKPSMSAITGTQPPGYFEFNTGVPLARLQDKQVSVYVISRCRDCKESVKRVFISEDRDRRNREDNKRYVTIKDWMLQTNCQQAELVPMAADSVLRLVIQQPDQNLDKVSAATAVLGAAPVANFLTTLISVVGATGFPQNNWFASTMGPGKIHYGEFLLASPMFHSANTGFNFSPTRDMSEAVFWNASATALSPKRANISLLTNLRNNGKLGGFYKVNDKFSLGAGFLYTRQDEFRRVSYVQGANPPRVEDSVRMNLKEYAAFLSPAYKISNQLSVGLTVKSTWQDFNIPNFVFVGSVNGGKATFFDSSIREQHFDVDVSVTFKASPALQVGLTLNNLAGTELYADAFIPGQANVPLQQQRSLGLGLLYKWERLNLGSDILLTEDGLYDASIGANYVPFNNALISAGLTVKQLGYSVAFRIKHFRISYISDNDWMVNERRKPKSSFLDGRIHGGFVFDFN